MTLFPIATPATSMKFFSVAVAAMAWSVVFLFLAARFLFTAPIIAGLAVGLVALLYAMGALVRGTSRHMREMLAGDPQSERGNAWRVLTGSLVVGTITIVIALIGQLLSGLFGAKPFGALADLWLGLLVFGLVIQLYGQAAYLRNLA